MRVSKEDFEATKFLGGVVGAKYPFLKRIAMLDAEERELSAYVECLKILIKNWELLEKKTESLDPKEFELFIAKIIEPIIERLGEAKYRMGEISHLACKIGSQKRRFKESYPTFEISKE